MILVRGPMSGGSKRYRVVPSSGGLRLAPRGLGAMVACPLEYVSNDGQCCNFIDPFGDCIGEGPGQTITSADGTKRQIFDTYELVTSPSGTVTRVARGAASRPGGGAPAASGFDLNRFVSDNGTAIAVGSALFVGVLFLFRK